jgi:ABC-2 type transport system permease protein
MNNLLYKEFRLSIHPFYYILPVFTGALMLIPQWIFFLVPLYFCFISASNLFSTYKSNNDLNFSAMLPIPKRDIVKARIISILILELMHIAWAAAFALLNRTIYHTANFSLDLNPAFFGLIFIMFSLFNLILFPLFYQTGQKFGFPVILATTAAILFAAAAELLAVFSDPFRRLMETPGRNGFQLASLTAGMLLFALGAAAAIRLSINRFEKVDIT